MGEIALDTRLGAAIENFQDRTPPIAGEVMHANALRAQYISATHRPTPVCNTYNCHGLTFASRRTAIERPSEVRKILTEDDYERVASVNNVLAGDVVIYVSASGDIEHSGVVVDVPILPGGLIRIPKILSKWGSAHEVIHYVTDCPYADTRIEYYRVTK